MESAGREIREEAKILEGRILTAQRKLRKINPEHSLLGVLKVNEGRVSWTPLFSARYGDGVLRSAALEEYVNELEEVVGAFERGRYS